ncbi:MAG: hypothetical protein EHM45_22675, partial [Desulfobacteraceae bacterium]
MFSRHGDNGRRRGRWCTEYVLDEKIRYFRKYSVHPLLLILLTDGCFRENGMFKVAARFDPKALEEIFRLKVFRLLLTKGKITEDMVKLFKSWRHSGFHVFCGNRIQPGDKDAMESLARYIIRACFSQERMSYIP